MFSKKTIVDVGKSYAFEINFVKSAMFDKTNLTLPCGKLLEQKCFAVHFCTLHFFGKYFKVTKVHKNCTFCVSADDALSVPVLLKLVIEKSSRAFVRKFFDTKDSLITFQNISKA